MIFVTDAAGQCVHLSRDWPKLTGQEIADALGWGWLECVHLDDRPLVRRIREDAVKTGSEFSMRYRLTRPNGSFRWVGSGGVPSFGMDNTFIGFLGSLTELADGATDTITAYGAVERFAPPPPHPATMPSCALDLVADHLIKAHAMIEHDGGKEALPDLRAALFKIGRALAKRTQERIRTLN